MRCSNQWRCDSKECYSEASGSNYRKAEEIGCEVEEFDDAVRVRAEERLHKHTCEDTSVSGISDRYAAADRL